MREIDRFLGLLKGPKRVYVDGPSRSCLIIIVSCILFSIQDVSSKETNNTSESVNRISVGILQHDVDSLWSWFQREEGIVVNIELTLNNWNRVFLFGELRPNVGLNISNVGDTSSIYGGFLWEKFYKNGLFVSTGINLAVHDGELRTERDDKKSLGSRVLFRIPLEIGYSLTEDYWISILFEHKSNGFLFEENEGMDELGFRISYSF